MTNRESAAYTGSPAAILSRILDGRREATPVAETVEAWNGRGGDSAYAAYQSMCCGEAATGHQNGPC